AAGYAISACCGPASSGAGVTRSSIFINNACGVPTSEASDTARNCFWSDASVAAKLVRASICPVENQLAPSGHPATFGGSYSVWPMAASGDRALSSEKFCQPISLIDRTTYSTGHEYRA